MGETETGGKTLLSLFISLKITTFTEKSLESDRHG